MCKAVRHSESVAYSWQSCIDNQRGFPLLTGAFILHVGTKIWTPDLPVKKTRGPDLPLWIRPCCALSNVQLFPRQTFFKHFILFLIVLYCTYVMLIVYYTAMCAWLRLTAFNKEIWWCNIKPCLSIATVSSLVYTGITWLPLLASVYHCWMQPLN